MIRTIFAAVGLATAGVLVLAAPAVADDEDPAPGFQLPTLQELGFDPYVQVCAGTTTPVKFIGVAGCSDDVLGYLGLGL